MAQHSDLEAGIELPNIPALVALSSAREPVRIPKQSRLRSKWKPKFHPPRIEQASEQVDQFFETLRAELRKGSREHCLFVCWENEVNNHRAVPILINNREDKVKKKKNKYSGSFSNLKTATLLPIVKAEARKGSPLSKESDKSSDSGTLILKGLLIAYPSPRRDSSYYYILP
ncbi:hypothetical protein DL95DRAFT_479526 [Leptodontidium sp. 2 PMI_412]|nr:hypothetical protein DL95DRAFT_479526 [Leptodontidium sp. 2 PMI_412]